MIERRYSGICVGGVADGKSFVATTNVLAIPSVNGVDKYVAMSVCTEDAQNEQIDRRKRDKVRS